MHKTSTYLSKSLRVLKRRLRGFIPVGGSVAPLHISMCRHSMFEKEDMLFFNTEALNGWKITTWTKRGKIYRIPGWERGVGGGMFVAPEEERWWVQPEKNLNSHLREVSLKWHTKDCWTTHTLPEFSNPKAIKRSSCLKSRPHAILQLAGAVLPASVPRVRIKSWELSSVVLLPFQLSHVLQQVGSDFMPCCR